MKLIEDVISGKRNFESIKPARIRGLGIRKKLKKYDNEKAKIES
jgi:hypothetical protein